VEKRAGVDRSTVNLQGRLVQLQSESIHCLNSGYKIIFTITEDSDARVNASKIEGRVGDPANALADQM